MSKQYLSTPLRRSVRRFMVTGLTTAAFVSASMSVSADSSSVCQIGSPYTFSSVSSDALGTVYAVHDEGLNDSQIVTINNDGVTGLIPKGTHPGLDIEGLDVNSKGDIYGSSGDDGKNPGHLYKINPDGSLEAGIKICFDFPGDTGLALEAGLEAQVVCDKEISSLSFNPADDTLWGWAEECGLIKIDPIPNAIDPIPNATLVFAFPNDDGGETCLNKNPPDVTPIVEDMTWDNAGEKIYYAHKSDVWVYDPIMSLSSENPAMLYDKIRGNIEAIEMFPGINDKLLLKDNSHHLTVLKDILTPSSTTHYSSPIAVGDYKDIEAIGTSGTHFSKLLCLLNDTSWIYSKDSFDDSTSPVAVGNTEFEIYGMAVRVDQETVTVAINSRLPVGGMSYHGEQIAWGDVVFDFLEPTGPNEIGESKIKYGVHFDVAGDSGVEDGVGLYEVEVTGLKSVSKANRGHTNFTTYKDYTTATERGPGHPSLGDLPILDNDYFGNKDKMPTSIDTGIKVEDDGFVMLDKALLENMGLDFVAGLTCKVPAGVEEEDDITPVKAYNGPYKDDYPSDGGDEDKLENVLGQYTFGFQFKRQPDMEGKFLIHIFTECGNDGMVLKGILPDCP